MKIDMKEIERIGGREKNPDIAAALRILELNELVSDEPVEIDRHHRNAILESAALVAEHMCAPQIAAEIRKLKA